MYSESWYNAPIMYIVYPLAKSIWMISLCYCSWCYVWFEMRCRYDVSAPLIMILIGLDVPSFFIHIQSNVRMDPCDLLSCVDVETMLIYIDIAAVASLRRTLLSWFIVSICWHFLFSSFVCCFPIQNRLALALVEVIYCMLHLATTSEYRCYTS